MTTVAVNNANRNPFASILKEESTATATSAITCDGGSTEHPATSTSSFFTSSTATAFGQLQRFDVDSQLFGRCHVQRLSWSDVLRVEEEDDDGVDEAVASSNATHRTTLLGSGQFSQLYRVKLSQPAISRRRQEEEEDWSCHGPSYSGCSSSSSSSSSNIGRGNGEDEREHDDDEENPTRNDSYQRQSHAPSFPPQDHHRHHHSHHHHYTLKCLDIQKVLTTTTAANSTTTTASTSAAASAAIALNASNLLEGARRLVHEAVFLSRLQHPHIVSLVGICSDCVSNSYWDDACQGYFLLLQQVQPETLQNLLHQWKIQKIRMGRGWAAGWYKSKQPNQQHNDDDVDHTDTTTMVWPLAERLEKIALGIAAALMYLHTEHRVAVTNLTASSIGFCARSGTVQLLTLDQAVCVAGSTSSSDHHRQGLHQPHRTSLRDAGLVLGQDVCDFGRLLWQVATLQDEAPPTGAASPANSTSFYHHDQFRSLTKKIPCKKTRQLIQDCCHHWVDARPTMSRVWLELQSVYRPTISNNSFRSKAQPGTSSTSKDSRTRKSWKLLFWRRTNGSNKSSSSSTSSKPRSSTRMTVEGLSSNSIVTLDTCTESNSVVARQ